MGVLDTYYNAITRQILTEIELISTLLSHQGLKGAHNELVLRDLLVRFLPRRYGVGSGIVIDSQGHSSRQCDMIIYDNFEHPQLMQQRSAVMIPVESVYATVEIKTTLRSQDVEDIAENSRSVKQLWYHQEQIMSLRQSDGGLDFWAQQASSPMTFFVAYDTGYSTLEGLCNAVLSKLNGLPETERLTAGIVINAGMTFMHQQVPIPQIGEKMRAGVFLLLQEGHEQEGTPIQLDADFIGPYIHHGFHYPVYKHSGHNRPVDPPRAFLSFLLSLLKTLDSKKITQRPFYTDYVPRHYSTFHFIEESSRT